MLLYAKAVSVRMAPNVLRFSCAAVETEITMQPKSTFKIGTISLDA
jgi:hypothetical protein